MRFIVKLVVEQFPKLHGTNESVNFVTPGGLKMKSTFSYSALHIPKLDLNFKIFVIITTFLNF
jgi:hypothetical protein